MSNIKDTSRNKRNNRRAYLNDFKKDETGAYIYCGAVYDYEGSEKSLRSLKVRLSTLSALALAALLWAGLIRVPGMDHSIYILLPYAASLCGIISVCWALGQLCIGGISLRAYLYLESIEKLPVRCVFTACCSMASLISELVYILINGIGIKDIGCILFLIQQIVVIASVLRIRSCVMHATWHKHNETAAKSEILPK